MKCHQITILDLAKELGISKSTVSRALTGHPGVKRETRDAILRRAAEMDYQRNMNAVSLLKRSSKIIGIVVPELITSYFSKVIIGAQKVAATAGYNVLISQSDETYATEVANTKVMLERQVDGIIISMTKETRNYDHFKIFQRKGIPIVFFNRICEEMDVPKVVVDDYDAAFRMVEHLILTGKKRIAHLAGPLSLSLSEKRLNGYLMALKKYNIPVAEELIIPYDLNLKKVKIYVTHLLQMEKRPDALFAINDPTAIEAILTIKRAGFKIPKDISVAGFSNDSAGALIEPSLTTISQPVEKIGSTAAQLLMDQINRPANEWKPIIKKMTTELVIRDSTKLVEKKRRIP